MVDKTEIFNAVCIKLGVARVSGPDAQSEPARVINEVYSRVCRRTLRSHVWSFAKESVSLPALATAPLFGFTYAFQLPSNFLRLVQFGDAYVFDSVRGATGGPGDLYTIEGRTILTDVAAPLHIVQLKDVSETPSEFDAMFPDVLACDIALEVASSLTKKDTTDIERQRKRHINEAKRVNAIELPPRNIEDGSWVTVRY